ncbi:MAG: enoyl-CoA hydratase [Balneolaceae bacterium]|nr:MAG: enoyl-CoA hydratase [Balneolaceae bacterium]
MSDPHFSHLLTGNLTDEILLLTINRPGKLNALNREVLAEIEQAVRSFEDSSELLVMVITGAGEKAFVAGADISELSTLSQAEGENLSAAGQRVMSTIELCSKPVIALVNGYALGGGAELAMACHLRIATENALIGLPEVSLGLIPGYGGTQRLPRLAGRARAMEMILTGEPVNASDALMYGIVNDVVPADQALEAAKKMAERIVKNGPLAISKAIRAISAAYPSRGFTTEAVLFGELCATDDFREGTGAFLEKRKAVFKGR